jgi:hypothetical protein
MGVLLGHQTDREAEVEGKVRSFLAEGFSREVASFLGSVRSARSCALPIQCLLLRIEILPPLCHSYDFRLEEVFARLVPPRFDSSSSGKWKWCITRWKSGAKINPVTPINKSPEYSA